MSLSTASAPPAGTFDSSAACMVREFKLLISSFKRPQALPNTSLLFKELEHTSSAKLSFVCAGVKDFGFMSDSSTSNPSSASLHAASHPASPAPITLTLRGILITALFALRILLLFRKGRGVIARLFGAAYLLALFDEISLAAFGALFARGDIPA